MKRYLLGFDLGTTNAKAVLFDEDGNMITSASATYPLIQPGQNMVEQRGQDWWSATVDILKTISAYCGRKHCSKYTGHLY